MAPARVFYEVLVCGSFDSYGDALVMPISATGLVAAGTWRMAEIRKCHPVSGPAPTRSSVVQHGSDQPDQAASSARRLRAWKSKAPTVSRWMCMIAAISFCLKRSK